MPLLMPLPSRQIAGYDFIVPGRDALFRVSLDVIGENSRRRRRRRT
jgi:hypothetical protein